jgi:hypothetical protein
MDEVKAGKQYRKLGNKIQSSHTGLVGQDEIYRVRQKKCKHTLTDGICVLLSEMN